MIHLPQLKQHTDKWKGCEDCPLGKLAYKHVLYQLLPEEATECGVLIIGEAPGEGEDIQGIPFWGRSGKLLREVIKAVNQSEAPYAISNVIACRPVDKVGGKNRSPKPFEVAACSSRLKELMQILNPKVVLCLGVFAQQNTPEMLVDGKPVPIYDTCHPSLLLRTGGTAAPRYEEFVLRVGLAFEHAREVLEETK
jgi:uracil-DNA glycosylase family 4